jgi:hypothetical protein
MNIKANLRRITELGIGLTAVAILALAGCGGGGEGSAPPSWIVSTFAGTSGSHGVLDATGTAARFMGPAYVTSYGNYMYVTDASANNIRRIDITTGEVSIFAGSATGESGVQDNTGTLARFYLPVGITNDGTNLYVVDNGNSNIRQIAISGAAVTTIAGSTTGVSGWADTPGTTARFNLPIGITRIGTNLFVSDSENCTIRKIDLSSAPFAVSTLAGSTLNCSYANSPTGGTGTTARFHYPTGLTTDGASFLYVTDTLNNDVRKINASTGETTLVAGGNFLLSNSGVGSTDAIGDSARFHLPYGITTDGTNLYVTDTYNYTVRKIVIATGFVSTPAGMVAVSGLTDGTGPNARFGRPMGVIYINGALYVADYSNGSIRKIQL